MSSRCNKSMTAGDCTNLMASGHFSLDNGQPDIVEIVIALLQIANGLVYVYYVLEWAYGDVKLANCLVLRVDSLDDSGLLLGKECTALKITDLDHAGPMDDTGVLRGVRGTTVYRDPHTAADITSEATDVYSFGLCILELANRKMLEYALAACWQIVWACSDPAFYSTVLLSAQNIV